MSLALVGGKFDPAPEAEAAPEAEEAPEAEPAPREESEAAQEGDSAPSTKPAPEVAKDQEAGPKGSSEVLPAGGAPVDSEEGGASGPTSSKRPKPAPPEKMTEKERRRAELESFLGPSVRSPVPIPDNYAPNDRSLHPMFHVELDGLAFAGPLDLLLHLIRRHDLDVLDIPIAFVTDRYLEALEDLAALEIDVAAEFLLLAAELIQIKSKMLLPAEVGVPVEDLPGDAEVEDPRAELVRRLLEHQKYKDAAERLDGRPQLGRDVFPRVPPPPGQVDDAERVLQPVLVFRLVELMARLLREVPVHHQIRFESFTIGERIQYVSAFAEARGGRFTLRALVLTIASRAELVVTFIAVLEMAKMGLARIAIGAPEGSEEPSGRRREPAFEAAAPSAELDGGSEPSSSSGEDEMPSEAPAEDEAPSEAPAEDEAPAETQAEWTPAEAQSQDLAAAVRAEAAELEALLAEEDAEGPVVVPAAVPGPSPAPSAPEAPEPLPEVWIELTERRFQGAVEDDYR